MATEQTITALMRTNNLSRPEALKVFEIAETQKINVARALQQVKQEAPLPSLKQTAGLPQGDDQLSRFQRFSAALNSTVALARRQRNSATLDFLSGQIKPGAVSAGTFTSLLADISRASERFTEPLVEQALDVFEGEDRDLTISEAKSLGVPIGTKLSEVKGKIPGDIDDTLDDDGFSYAEELIRLNPDATDVELRTDLQKQPKETRLSESEINNLLRGRITDDDIRFEAEELIVDMWDKKFKFSREDEFTKAVEKAKADIREGGIIVITSIDGKKKTVNLSDEDIQKRFISMIDSIDFDSALEILKAR